MTATTFVTAAAEAPSILLAGAGSAPSTLAPAAWDIVSFLGNAQNYGALIGGGVISLLGLITIIIAGVFTFQKFLGNGQREAKSWVLIVVMIIIGGAMLTGSITLLMSIASGGQKTIEELGGGIILLSLGLG